MKRLLLAAFLLSCGPAEVGDEPQPPKPFDGTVEPGSSTSLLSVVTGSAGSAAVAWSVDPGGGSVTPAGVYTAPSCSALLAALPAGTDVSTVGAIAGTDTVRASWDGGSMTIPITVLEGLKNPPMTVACVPVSLPPGGTAQCSAVWHYSCHDARAQ